jgi:hypothetical protein
MLLLLYILTGVLCTYLICYFKKDDATAKDILVTAILWPMILIILFIESDHWGIVIFDFKEETDKRSPMEKEQDFDQD